MSLRCIILNDVNGSHCPFVVERRGACYDRYAAVSLLRQPQGPAVFSLFLLQGKQTDRKCPDEQPNQIFQPSKSTS